MRFLKTVIVLASLSTPVMAGTIEVSGEGLATYTPDMATYSAGIETQAKTVQEAVSKNSTQMQDVIGVLKDMEIESKNIQTSQFSVNPVYSRRNNNDDGSYTQTVTGYRVNNTLTVRITDMDRLGSLLDALAKAGVNQGSNLQFGIQDDTALVEQARRGAVKDAKQKATVLAEEAGVSITGLETLTEQSYNAYPRPMGMQMARAVENDSVPIEQGEQSISVKVQAVYTFGDQ